MQNDTLISFKLCYLVFNLKTDTKTHLKHII